MPFDSRDQQQWYHATGQDYLDDEPSSTRQVKEDMQIHDDIFQEESGTPEGAKKGWDKRGRGAKEEPAGMSTLRKDKGMKSLDDFTNEAIQIHDDIYQEEGGKGSGRKRLSQFSDLISKNIPLLASQGVNMASQFAGAGGPGSGRHPSDKWDEDIGASAMREEREEQDAAHGLMKTQKNILDLNDGADPESKGLRGFDWQEGQEIDDEYDGIINKLTDEGGPGSGPHNLASPHALMKQQRDIDREDKGGQGWDWQVGQEDEGGPGSGRKKENPEEWKGSSYGPSDNTDKQEADDWDWETGKKEFGVWDNDESPMSSLDKEKYELEGARHDMQMQKNFRSPNEMEEEETGFDYQKGGEDEGGPGSGPQGGGQSDMKFQWNRMDRDKKIKALDMQGLGPEFADTPFEQMDKQTQDFVLSNVGPFVTPA